MVGVMFVEEFRLYCYGKLGIVWCDCFYVYFELVVVGVGVIYIFVGCFS